MTIKSTYILYSQVISLDKLPFLNRSIVRPAFRNIFSNEQCFSKSLEHFQKTNRENESFSRLFRFKKRPNYPFIKNLGSIAFNPVSVRLEETSSRVYLGLDIAQKFSGEEIDDWIEETFGYDSALEDQRMNHLYFELLNPIFVSANISNEFQADGKIFLHLYPSGFAVLHLAITIKNKKYFIDLETLHAAIKETRPWRSDSQWHWTSRVGNGKLTDIIKLINEKFYQSVFIETSKPINNDRWITSLKIVGDIEIEIANKKFHNGNAQVFRLHEKLALSDSKEYFLINNQGLTSILSSQRERKATTELFWKLINIYEFVMLKNQIYDNYAEFFRYETMSLKKFSPQRYKKTDKRRCQETFSL